MNVKSVFSVVFGLLLVTSCEQNQMLDEVAESKVQTRAVRELSYFKDVESYTDSGSGEVYICGNIYCTEEAEYSFIFSFQGSEGSSYAATVGNVAFIRPDNGGNFREFKVKLKPGIHKCDVCIYFTDHEQSADARLVIKGINGSSAGSGAGFSDLVACGTSLLAHIVGSVPVHWTCPYCHFMLNGDGSDICISCGKSRSSFEE